MEEIFASAQSSQGPTHLPHIAPMPDLPGTPGFGPDAYEINNFLSLFATAMLSVGSPTARVCRNVARIASSFGFMAELVVFPKNFVLTVTRKNRRDRRTAVSSMGIGAPDFQKISGLNTLGWDIVDQHLSLQEARVRLQSILTGPKYQVVHTCIISAIAEAAFCEIFGGDLWAMLFVFFSTVVGYMVRFELRKAGFNTFITYFAVSFISSLASTPCILFNLGSTPQIALATSVLFLIPGIPLINATQDMLDGHLLMGFSRAVDATLLIFCIALGLALTMAILGVGGL